MSWIYMTHLKHALDIAYNICKKIVKYKYVNDYISIRCTNYLHAVITTTEGQSA